MDYRIEPPIQADSYYPHIETAMKAIDEHLRGLAFTWKGNVITDVASLMELGIDKCSTREEAQEFLKAYRAVNERADETIGYISGYYAQERRIEIQELFGVEHPIIKPGMTSKDIFEAGFRLSKMGTK